MRKFKKFGVPEVKQMQSRTPPIHAAQKVEQLS